MHSDGRVLQEQRQKKNKKEKERKKCMPSYEARPETESNLSASVISATKDVLEGMVNIDP